MSSLALELQALIDLDFAPDCLGFDVAEIDLILDESAERDPQQPD